MMITRLTMQATAIKAPITTPINIAARKSHKQQSNS